MGRRPGCWALSLPLMVVNTCLSTRVSKSGGDPITDSLDAGASLKTLEKGQESSREKFAKSS